MKTISKTYGQLEGNAMFTHILKIIMVVALLTGATDTARAIPMPSLSQPDVVYHGTALNAVTGNTVAITRVLNNVTTTLATCTVVGKDRKYELRVPMEDASGTRATTPPAARQGDTATISIQGVAVSNGTVVIPQFGTIVPLDLGLRDRAQWDKDHPGDDGSRDMNRNGKSDLQDYLDGNDPAGCLWNQVDADNVDTTVYHQEVLKNCLANPDNENVKKHKLIRVVKGTYSGNFSYISKWGEDYNLTLVGGYDPAGIAERSADPALTVLVGGTDENGVSIGSVLVVDTDTIKTSGKVHIESLTIKNGRAPAGNYGGGIRARIYKGDLELVGNIISGNAISDAIDNTANGGGGISVENSDSGSIFLTNNIIFGNSAANAAAVRIDSAKAGPVMLLNNTVIDNTATAAGDGRFILVKNTNNADVDVTNNIIFGNVGVTGKDIYINTGTVAPSGLVIMHNAIDPANVRAYAGFIPDPSNAVCTPSFVSAVAGDYRLGSASTCIDKGMAHAKLPAKDADGAGRISGSLVDLGAFEFLYGAVTKAATAETTNGATLNGSVNAKNTVTTVSFEYGLTTAYGTTVTATPDTVTGNSDAAVNAIISGLTPATAYHYRIVAASSAGTVYGDDLTFTTMAPEVATLTISFAGSGGNKVESTLPDTRINCLKGNSKDCSASYPVGTLVTLRTTSDWKSTFKVWSGNVISGVVTMDADKTVEASFDLNHKAKLLVTGDQQASIQDACDAAADVDTIQAQTYFFQEPEGVTVGKVSAKTITLKGGYDDTGFTTNTGMTSVQGPLKIRSGTLIVERLTVR